MDAVTFDDKKAARGARILARPTFDHRYNQSADCTGDAKPGKAETSSAGNGLDIGRRLLVCNASTIPQASQPQESTLPIAGTGLAFSGIHPPSDPACRVFDHGENQKEAIRRLFDAEVLLQSFSKEVDERNQEIEVLRKQLAEALRANGQSVIQLTAPHGQRAAQSRTSATESASLEVEEKAADKLSAPIPKWLLNDQQSREYVEHTKEVMFQEYMQKGRLESKSVFDRLWALGLAFAVRWGESPDEEVLKQNKAMEARLRKVQRDCLQESSMLRQQAKLLEQRYLDAQQALIAARRQAPAEARSPTAGPGQAQPASLPQAAPSPAQLPGPPGPPGRNTKLRTAEAPAGAPQPTQSAAADNQGRPASTADTAGDGSNAAGTSRAVDLDEWKPMSLADDPTLDVALPQEELQTMDNEIFEQLDAFDSDMKGLLVDVVNEKVRRILQLDPSKFKNGRLPFGLKPDMRKEGEEDVIGRLEAEIDLLKQRLEQMARERDKTRAQRPMNNTEELERLMAALKAAEKERDEALLKLQQAERQRPGPPDPIAVEPGVKIIEKVVEKIVEKKVIEYVQTPAKEPDKDAERKRIDAAVKEATAPLKEKIIQLESEIERLKKLLAEKPTSEVVIQERIVEKPVERIVEKVVERVVEKIVEKIVVQKEVVKQDRELQLEPSSEDAGKLEELRVLVRTASATARDSQKMLRRVLVKIASLVRTKDGAKREQAVATLLGRDTVIDDMKRKDTQPDAEPESADTLSVQAGKLAQALPEFQAWTQDSMKGLETLAQRPKEPEQSQDSRPLEPRVETEVVIQEKEVIVEKVVRDESQDKELAALRTAHEASQREVAELRQLNKEQELQIQQLKDEITRLLLTIDELRARLGRVQTISEESPPEVAASIGTLMKEVGLHEVVAARTPVVLKGVFERLYEDALQRVQRLGLVMQRRVAANRAYSAALHAAMSGPQEQAPVQDLQHLATTAEAVLAGMFYRSEHLFRSLCDYAEMQGVEASLSSEKLGFSDLLEELGRQEQEVPRRSRRKGKKHNEETCTPRQQRKQRLADPEPSSFASYVAARREARGDLGTEDWPRVAPSLAPHARERLTCKSEFTYSTPKSLRNACTQSLPALPKGRVLYQSDAQAMSPDKSSAANLHDI